MVIKEKQVNSVKGECFCKSVQFEIHFPTEFASHCHCESCRKSHGAAFVTWSAVHRNQFRFLRGEELLKTYRSSAQLKWSFCGHCGTNMLYHHDGVPEKVYFTVANLTGPLDREPDSHMSFEEKVSWFHPGDELPKFKAKTDDRI
jgi:hypothetical protein